MRRDRKWLKATKAALDWIGDALRLQLDRKQAKQEETRKCQTLIPTTKDILKTWGEDIWMEAAIDFVPDDPGYRRCDCEDYPCCGC